jgi:single stranded DNA-binding protein
MLIGNLGRDPELRLLATGQAEVTLSITTDEAFKGETHERLELHSVVAMGTLAESCKQHLKKGALVYVEGELRSRESLNPDDINGHRCTVILASRVRSLEVAPKATSGADIFANPVESFQHQGTRVAAYA